MPSMPLFLWGDRDGQRLREAYFSMYPGVWRHGDWIEITSRGTAIIYGRSDATINRGGVRMGTSEIYRVVLDVPEVVDALVVDLPADRLPPGLKAARSDADRSGAGAGAEGWMALFVVLSDGIKLDDRLAGEIRRQIRQDGSPRHVPNEIRQIKAVPRTLSGKILEVPVKRILTGTPPDQAAARESLANPEALDYFVALAADASGS
jgi:acetoacetyl-CoA synthetase